MTSTEKINLLDLEPIKWKVVVDPDGPKGDRGFADKVDETAILWQRHFGETYGEAVIHTRASASKECSPRLVSDRKVKDFFGVCDLLNAC